MSPATHQGALDTLELLSHIRFSHVKLRARDGFPVGWCGNAEVPQITPASQPVSAVFSALLHSSLSSLGCGKQQKFLWHKSHK